MELKESSEAKLLSSTKTSSVRLKNKSRMSTQTVPKSCASDSNHDIVSSNHKQSGIISALSTFPLRWRRQRYRR